MDRRDFLKGSVGMSLAGMTALLLQPSLEGGVLAAESPAAFAVHAQALGRLFQGTRDGQIFESRDGGQSWHRIAKFGEHCAITSIREARGSVYVDISVQDHRFAVKSTDARLWRLA